MPSPSSINSYERPRSVSSPHSQHEISMSCVAFHMNPEGEPISIICKDDNNQEEKQQMIAKQQQVDTINQQVMKQAKIPEGYTLIDGRPYEWTPPADAAAHPYRPHQGEGSQYLRDFILGINDGLISTLLLVVGMVGGGADSRAILLAAISAAIAGAIAMGLGEWIATKSQNDVISGEIRIEKEHFMYHRMEEIEQLRAHLKSVGLEGNLLEACVRRIASNDEHLMRIMERFEFGTENRADNGLTRSPLVAMLMSGRLFLLGSLPSILPFVQSDPHIGLIVACCASGVSLFGVGIYKTRTTGGNPWLGGIENFGAGALGAIISFCVGLAYDAIREKI